MLARSADTKISTGAPAAIWLAKVVDEPKEILIFVPGWEAINFFARAVYWSCRLEAAKTVTVLGVAATVGEAATIGATERASAIATSFFICERVARLTSSSEKNHG